jgi:hypothetical protein
VARSPDGDGLEGRVFVAHQPYHFVGAWKPWIDDHHLNAYFFASHQPNCVPAVQSWNGLASRSGKEFGKPANKTQVAIHNQDYRPSCCLAHVMSPSILS